MNKISFLFDAGRLSTLSPGVSKMANPMSFYHRRFAGDRSFSGYARSLMAESAFSQTLLQMKKEYCIRNQWLCCSLGIKFLHRQDGN